MDEKLIQNLSVELHIDVFSPKSVLLEITIAKVNCDHILKETQSKKYVFIMLVSI